MGKSYDMWSIGDLGYALYTENTDAMKLLERHNFRTFATYHDNRGKLFAYQLLVPRHKKDTVAEMLEPGNAAEKKRTTRKVRVAKKNHVAETTESVQGTLF